MFEDIEVAVYREQLDAQTSPIKRARYGLTWLKFARYIRQARQAFDGCTVVSPVEAKHVEQVAPKGASMRVIPNGVDVAVYAGDWGEPEPDTLIYPGALSFFANYDAAAWFGESILPLVAAQRPAVRFSITGRTAMSAYPW